MDDEKMKKMKEAMRILTLVRVWMEVAGNSDFIENIADNRVVQLAMEAVVKDSFNYGVATHGGDAEEIADANREVLLALRELVILTCALYSEDVKGGESVDDYLIP